MVLFGVGQAAEVYGLNIGFCNTYNPGQCSGSWSANYSNTINPSSVIAFNDSSQPSSQGPILKGMSGGNFGFNETGQANGCQVQGSGSAGVQVPTSIPVYKTINNGSTPSCPVGQAGWQRVVIRQVKDQNGVAMAVGGQQIVENVTVGPGTNGLNLYPGPSNATTDPQGQIIDTFKFCAPVCPTSAATTNFTQAVTDTYGSSLFNIGSYQITYACSNVKVNGLLTP